MSATSISKHAMTMLQNLTGAPRGHRKMRRPKARPVLECLEERMLLSSQPVYNGGTEFWSAPVSGWVTPLLVRESYGFPNLQPITVSGKTYEPDGSGQTIGIIAEGHESNLTASVELFDTQTIENQSQIPPLDGKNGDGWLKQVAIDGGAWTLGEPLENGSFETDLDVEWAHAMAPKANIVVVEVPFDSSGNANYSDLKTAAATAVRLGASVISMSFSGFGSDQPPFSFGGVTVVSTSADNGAFNIPAGSSSSLTVGGTEGKDGQSVVWNDNYTEGAPTDGSTPKDTVQGTGESTGGGVYPAGFPLPSWQKSAAESYASNSGGFVPSARMAPDVAALASNMATVDITDGKSLGGRSNRLATPWTNGEGTSYGAPIWAGIIAIVNQERKLLVPLRGPLNGIDPTLPMLYGLSDDLFDITQGWVNKGKSSERDAYPGYDLDTGLGEPLVEDLIPDLVQPFTGYFSQVEGNALVIATNQNGGTDNLSIGIEQTRNGQYLEVKDNNATDEFPVGSFTTIAVYARNATDNIKVSTTPAGITMSIQLGGGKDTVTLSNVDHKLSDIGGAVTIFGGTGTGELDAYDSRDVTANNNFWLTSNSLGGTTFPTISFSGLETTNIYGGTNLGRTTITYEVGVNRDGSIAQPAGPPNSFISLYMNGDDKSTENVSVVSTAATSFLTINLGAGTDTVTLSPTANWLNQLAGAVNVVGYGTGGGDTLNIDDQSNQTPSTYLIGSTAMSRSYWTGSALWSAIHTVNLRGGKGFGGDGTETYDIGDVVPGYGSGPAWSFNLYTTGTGTSIVNVENTPAAMGLLLSLPTKNNTVSIAPQSEEWSEIDGSVSIVATGSAATTLNIDDQKDTNAINYFVTSHSAGIDLGLPIGFVGVTQLYLNGGPGSSSGGETYHIGTASSGPMPLRAGPVGNVYLSVTALGVLPELISVVDEFYKAFNAAHFSLEGFAGISASGTKNDSLLVENSLPQNLPSGFAAAPQSFTVTRNAVNLFYSESQTTTKGRSNSAGIIAVGYSGVGWIGVDGAQAGEQFQVGDGQTNLDLLYPTVSIQGQSGDSLTINDTPAPAAFFTKEAPDFTIDSSRVTWANPVTVTLFGVTSTPTLTGEIDYSGVTKIELDGGPVKTTYSVEGTPLGSTFTIKNGAGGDSVIVGTGDLSSIGGSVAVVGQGAESLDIDDASSSAAQRYVIAADHIAWAPVSNTNIPTRLTYSGIPTLELDGAGGGNVITVSGRAAGTKTVVKAGAGNDTTKLQGNRQTFAGSLSIDGQGGVNTLDYSLYRGTVTVNLPLETATSVSGGIANIRNVTGSVGNNLLVGDGTGNVLKGGTNRNILIAGAHPGTLIGNSAGDILIGGTTSYDTSPGALVGILAEWTSGNSYALRVQHLLNGGGLNGNTTLSGTSGFTNNGGGNTLTGAADYDLFYGIKASDTNDWNGAIGEVFVENITPVSVKIDAHWLSSPDLFLDGSGITVLGTQNVATVSLLPGTHTLEDNWGYNYNAGAVSFRVLANGTVSYDDTSGVLGGAGTGTLVVRGKTITIDARGLDKYTSRLTVDYAIVGLTASPFPVTVIPGPQVFFDTYDSGSSIPFAVTPDGIVDYEHSQDSLLMGRQTSTLTLSGFAITIDATALSTPLITVDVAFAKPTASPIQINVLPGPQSLWDYYGSGSTVNFEVTPDGKISYDQTSPLAPLLSGIGTTTLTVTGEKINIDPRKLLLYALVVDTVIVKPMTSAFPLDLLPGDHWLTDNYGWSSPVHFNVGYDDTVSYEMPLEGILTGATTSTLTLNGETLQIDATALIGVAPSFTVATRGGLATDEVQTLIVLPGTFQFTAGSEQFSFTLSAQDKLVYDESLDGKVSGRDSNLLTVNG
jgi:hypothetical protein